MATLKEIKIKVKEIEIKKGPNKGKKFDSYRAVQKDGKLIDCRFRQEVKDLPTEDCYIVVDVDNMNYDRSREFPRLWIHAIEEIKQLTDGMNRDTEKAIIDEMF